MDLPSHLIRHLIMPSDEDYKYASLYRQCKITKINPKPQTSMSTRLVQMHINDYKRA